MFVVEIIIGLVLLSVGANFLTDGAASIAKKLKMSEFMIGATIVAIGTSMPELVVSLTGALSGQSEIAIGNVVGSNVFNVYAILGLTTMIMPMTLTEQNVKRDIPICLATTILVILLALDQTIWGGATNVIGRVDGIVLLLGYVIFLRYMIRNGREAQPASQPDHEPQTIATKPSFSSRTWGAVVMVVAGLGGLIWGSDLFLDGSIKFARLVGLSEAVISIVLVAVGTSLPELFASLVPALKGKSDMALGNILGSNIANILLILGASSTVIPLHLGGITPLDMGVMLSAVVAVLLSAYIIGRKKIVRIEGAIFFAIYVCYTLWLLR